MKNKRELMWFFMSLVVMFLNYSCQTSSYKTESSTSETDISENVLDTSLWLKETRGIRDILEDVKGNLWFSSPDYIAMYNGKSLKYFSEDDGLKIVGNIHEDQNGYIWIENGINIYRYEDEHFQEEKLNNNLVPNVSQGNHHGLWVQRGLNSTDTSYNEPGIYSFNQRYTKFFPFPLKRGNNNKYLYFPTTKTFYGKDSTIWAGTMEKVFGFKDNSFVSLGRKEMGRQDDPRQMGIRGIFVDSKGKLWIADNGAGIFVYNGKEIENFTNKHHLDEGDVEGSTLHKAFSIAEDSLGNMWFGTVYSGIWIYNPKTNEFKNYTKADGIKSENIWTIYKTKKGELLFAGESPAAVYKFNGNKFDRIY